MKELILNSIPDDYNPDKHTSLGLWCFLGREHLVKDWSQVDIGKDAFSNNDELLSESSVINNYINNKIKEVGQSLNFKMDLSYSERYWRVILLPWISLLIQTSYDRQMRLMRFIQDRRNISYRVTLIPENIVLKFDDTLDFLQNGILNTQYNAWLYSMMIRKLRPKGWQLVEDNDSSKYNDVKSSQKIKLKEKLKYLQSLLRFSGVAGISNLESLFWSLLLCVKPIRKKRVFKTLNFSHQNIDWLFDLDQLINKTMPNWISERKYHFFKGINSAFNRWSVVGSGIFYNEGLKRIIAKRIEKGGSVACVQHGGIYGTCLSAPLISESEYKREAFFTWGWTKHGAYRGNFVDLPSPQLKKKFIKSKHSKKILLVGTSMFPFTIRLDSVPQANQWLEYRKNKLAFIKILSTKVKKNLVYRPYLNHKQTIEDKLFIERSGCSLEIYNGKLEKAYKKTRLFVIDHPITTFAYSMSFNIPTIGFWDKKIWGFTPQSNDLYQGLVENHIVHHSPESAAIHLNEVWDCLDSWWHSSEVQKARSDWCYNYARSSHYWRFDWLKAIWKL